ncbi:replication-relaxation family protein [Microbacterium sp. RURRCA19A]|uniref:replication-relaxation family protein n=1 Tax=Microbacterium sp. RURRCA19A TaxID=1907391 RepID=UPI0009554C77|nr:replication-relaxation family protein [Microbacterium sp. RURRCA19A]SIS10547.1 Replication-relaxation [Microbacterium sp. RURRCA19A]
MNSDHTAPRISQAQLALLKETLSDRDRDILGFLAQFRYATTSQARRRYFTGHTSQDAATRATLRVLDRLLERRLITRLERRVGGHPHGSAAYIWHLDVAGERLTRKTNGPRRRYADPAWPFLEHTLQITDTAITLHELATESDLEVAELQVEPDAWRSFLTPQGRTAILKPDLFATVAAQDFDDHWYLEIDRGTESLPVLVQKCHTYAAYKATGRAQVEHGVFPRVLWVVPTQRRVARLTAAIAEDSTLPNRLFTLITPGEFVTTVTPLQGDITEPGEEAS